MNSFRLPATILIALSLVIAIQTGVFAAGDQPDYQHNNNIQNIWENHLAWLDYTNDIDTEIADEATTAERTMDLYGEALSASLNYMTHLNGFSPEANCAWDFWYMTSRVTQEWTNFYAASFHFLAADVGQPANIEAILQNAIDTQLYFGEVLNWTEAKCINKLDI